MLDERPSGPSDDQLEDLGLSRDDLGAFDVNADDGAETGTEADVGDQESTLERPPAPITETDAAPADKADQQQPPRGPAERPPEAPTPHAKAELDRHKARPSATPERPAAAPGEEKPPAAAPSSSKPDTTTAVVPWTPTVDGRRLAIEGATVQADGSVVISKAGVPNAIRNMADRNVWRTERERYEDVIAGLNPENNEHVILSRLLAEEMTKAEADGGEEGLWRWVQDFKAAMPRLKAEAKAEAATRDNKRLRSRTDAIDQQAAWAELEPRLQDALAQELDAYLELPQLQGLKPQRARLAARFWNELRGEVFKSSDGDYPEHNLRKGDPFIVRPVLERELVFAADLLKQDEVAARTTEQRTDAERRNAAALGQDPPVPPAAPVGGRPLPGNTDGEGRPKDRQAWLDRMSDIAESPVR